MSSARRILHLPGRANTPFSEDEPVTLDFFEVLLPCRRFEVVHKVTEPGPVSITVEFLLRLLHAVDGMEERAIASFFGFNDRELAYVMGEVVANDYVTRSEGGVWLTATGRSLFSGGTNIPQIFAVTQQTVTVGLDLISLAPQENGATSSFENRLGELPIPDVTLVASATTQVGTSFRRFFSEIMARRERDLARNVSLYSIDHVTATRRFSSSIPVFLRSPALRPDDVSPHLESWRSLQEIEDRSRIVEALASYIEGMKTNTRADDRHAYELLIQMAPKFLEDFTRRDGLAVERYYSAAVARAGELRIDRPTVPLLGTAFVPENNTRLREAVDYGLKRRTQDESVPAAKGLLWLVPDLHWGYSKVLPATVEGIESVLVSSSDSVEEEATSQFQRVALSRERVQPHVGVVFPQVERLREDSGIPPTVEILWIPKVAAAMLIHVPIRSLRAIPVPLGFLSFDSEVVTRVGRLLSQHSPTAAAWNGVG